VAFWPLRDKVLWQKLLPRLPCTNNLLFDLFCRDPSNVSDIRINPTPASENPFSGLYCICIDAKFFLLSMLGAIILSIRISMKNTENLPFAMRWLFRSEKREAL